MRILFLTLLLTISFYAKGQNDSIPKDAVHLREVPKHNLVIDLGLSSPTGDYKDVAVSGLNIGAGYDFYMDKHWALTASTRYVYNEFSPIGSSQQTTINNEENWSAFTLAIGPQYSFTNNRFQLDAFTRIGFQFIDEQETSATSSLIETNYATDSENFNTTAAVLQVGLRFNYYFRRSVQVFFSPQYMSTLGEPIAYFSGNGTVDRKLTNFSNILFNVGLKIAIGPEYSNGEMRDDSF
ncbi:outer membrane beta-barrel protein [Nonlabens sp. SCSIO 43208]|uniref:autotransporter outer membrane beta-barrel domain-containing protein n=1 Tax=Nonlabens sp. SCSIO 43208 TaxID=2793009 RepID=UPI003D6C2C15